MKSAKLLLCILCTMTLCLSAYGFPDRERTKHCIWGVSKMGIATANMGLMAYVAHIIYQDIQVLRSRNLLDGSNKLRSAKMEIACLSIMIPSLSYVALIAYKSAIQSLKEAGAPSKKDDQVEPTKDSK